MNEVPYGQPVQAGDYYVNHLYRRERGPIIKPVKPQWIGKTAPLGVVIKRKPFSRDQR